MVALKGAVKEYKGFSLNIDMEIKPGRVVGLIGRNGSGKTTTLKLIIGLRKADKGEVTVFGKRATKLSREDKENIGVALADSTFSNYLNVNDIRHILKKMYINFDEKAFDDGVKQLDLPEDKQIKTFSSGMNAKLRVLIAITHKAKFLVLDEPTAGLDVEARRDILDIIRKYLAEDEERTLLITSHISSDLEGICDEIFLINKGQVFVHEDTDVILDKYGILKVDEDQYAKLDKDYIISARKESFGYQCFTSEKQYYIENYPGIVVENASIDEMILSMGGIK